MSQWFGQGPAAARGLGREEGRRAEKTFPTSAEAAPFRSSVSFLFYFIFIFFLMLFSFSDLTISHAERIQRFFGHKPKGNQEKGWFAQPLPSLANTKS